MDLGKRPISAFRQNDSKEFGIINLYQKSFRGILVTGGEWDGIQEAGRI